MKPLTDRLLAYAELARATNVPTVATNVLAGAGLGVAARTRAAPADAPAEATSLPAPVWGDIGLLALGVSLLYVGGMVMNSVVDRDVDARERPGRPIPGGRVAAGEAWGLCILVLALGAAAVLGASAQTGVLLAILLACIAGYNLWRPGGRRSLTLMGACRGLVYPIAAVGVGADRGSIWVVLGVGAAAGVYTAVFSVVARDEAGEARARPIAWALPWMGLVAGAIAAIEGPGAGMRDDIVLVIVAIGAMAWLGSAARAGGGRPVDPKRCVLGAIAGFCVVDALVLVAVGMEGLAAAALAMFVVTTVGHRRISGT